jgi:arginyl-tRNA synthetase
MFLKVDSKIFQNYPELLLGVIVIKDMDNAKKQTAITQLMSGACAQQKNKFAKDDLEINPTIKVWRETYQNFGADPSKSPCSVEALLKRVIKGDQIPKINTLVDLYNYFSIKNIMPIGGEDLDQLCGDVKLTFSNGETPFRAIGSEKIEYPDEGEVVYRDSGGVTCRRWNYRECDRTKFMPQTKNAIIILEDMGMLGEEKLQEKVHELAQLIQKYCGGEIEEHILNQKTSEIDLGIAGRTGINDAEYQGTVISKKGHKFLPKTKSKKKKKLEGDTLVRIKLEGLIVNACKKAFPEKEVLEAEIEWPKDESHGDYSCNIAMSLSKELKQPPREIAEEVIKKISKPSYIDKIEIAGPGFVNFYLAEGFLQKEVDKILKGKEKYGSLKIGKDRTVVVEFSQPNIAKPLGVHHLMSTIIGQSIYNIYKFLGFDCISVNHIGDWGTQFGKLIYAYKNWGVHEVIEKKPIDELLKLYVRFHDEAENDSSLEDSAREEFKKLEDGDEQNMKLWEWFRKISLEEIQKTYDVLGGIHFDHTQGEAFYNKKMDSILEDGKNKKVFVEGDEGSVVVKFENDKYPPYLVLKSDGATLYSTRDLAAVKYRQDTWSPEKIIYVVDVAQSLHFQQLFETMDLLGTRTSELMHVVFGRMQFSDKKMSTRKGNIILLDEVLGEAEKKAGKIVEEKNSKLSEEEKEKAAHSIGIGSVKYSVLSQNRNTNIVFDWDKILSLEGNSAPYLQYSYARAKSILRKALEPEVETPANTEKAESKTSQVTLFEAIDDVGDAEEVDVHKDSPDAEEKERAVMRDLAKFSEHIALAAADYRPNILANYLHGLAQKFNNFYNNVNVLQSGENKEFRLKLVEATAQVLKNGLGLLGIDVLEKM